MIDPALYRSLRPLRVLPKHTNADGSRGVKVLSYNLMAQHHIWSSDSNTAALLPGQPTLDVPLGISRWNYRKRCFTAELASMSFDIGCFQEMFKWEEFFCQWFSCSSTLTSDSKLFHDGNSSTLPCLQCAYEGKFVPKGMDGCAVVWKRDRFDLVSYEAITFDAVLAALRAYLERSPRNTPLAHKKGTKYTLKANVAQVVVLHDKYSGKKLVIGNTHLYWKASCEWVRLLQMHTLRTRMEKMRSSPEDILILAGGT